EKVKDQGADIEASQPGIHRPPATPPIDALEHATLTWNRHVETTSSGIEERRHERDNGEGEDTCVGGQAGMGRCPATRPIGTLEHSGEIKPSIEGGGSARVKGEGEDTEINQAGIDRRPATPPIGTLEDATAKNPNIERGGRERVKDQVGGRGVSSEG